MYRQKYAPKYPPPPQMPKSPPIPIPPTRPFLRRQESHSHMPPTAAYLRGGRGMAAIRRIVAHDTVRFLPTQEWSSGGREYIAKKYAPKCPPPPPQMPKSPPIPIPPQAHSCEGKNLTVQCIQISANPHNPPSPTRPFLRRQESHSHMPPTAASLMRRTGNGDN